MKSYKDKIGFLPYEEPIQFYNGGLYPIKEFEETREVINKEANLDGFFYPPVMHTVRQSLEVVNNNLEIKEKVVSNSNRPVHLFKMPASHKIEIIRPVSGNDPKKGDGLFLTYLVAFHFGIRLQFCDWWFDGRVPVKIERDFCATHSATENFIDKAYGVWSKASDDGKKLLTNLLFMQSRVKSYEWDWERFLISYMVFDGCYKYLKKKNNWGKIPHKDRFKAVIDYFKMQYDQDWVDRIVDLRNKLFHETLWDGGQPCNANSTLSVTATFHLAKLNSRIITAIFGYKGEYIQSSWCSGSMFLF